MSSSSLSRRLVHLAIAPPTTVPSSSRSICTSIPRLEQTNSPSPSTSSRSWKPSSPPQNRRSSFSGGGRSRFGASPRGPPGQGRDRGSRSSGGRGKPPLTIKDFPPYAVWLETTGKAQFAEAEGKGPFWIGSTPFPLNPTFNPPPPVAQAVKDEMWKMHTGNPERWNLRNLSGLFGQTMERTLAILRLKALEKEMQAALIPLQSHFQSEMERLLGSEAHLPRPSEDPKRPDRLERPDSERESTPLQQKAVVKNIEARGLLVEGVSEEQILYQNRQGGEDAAEDEAEPHLAKELAASKRENIRRLTLLPSGEPNPKKISKKEIKEFLAQSKGNVDLEGRESVLRIVNLSANAKDPHTSVYDKVGTLEKSRKRAEKKRRVAEKKKMYAAAEQAAKAAKAAEEGAGKQSGKQSESGKQSGKGAKTEAKQSDKGAKEA